MYNSLFKNCVIASIILFSSAKVGSAEPINKVAFRQLLESVPHWLIIENASDLVKHPEKARYKEELEGAKKQVELAKTNIPKLKSVLKKGHSVFEYPGLIVRGKLSFVAIKEISQGEYVWGYKLTFSVRLSIIQGVGFAVIFNDKGLIEEIYDMDFTDADKKQPSGR